MDKDKDTIKIPPPGPTETPRATAAVSDAVDEPAGKVTVVCNQPNGLVLHLPNDDRSVTLRGGINHGIDAQFIEAWQAQHAGTALLGLIAVDAGKPADADEKTAPKGRKAAKE